MGSFPRGSKVRIRTERDHRQRDVGSKTTCQMEEDRLILRYAETSEIETGTLHPSESTESGNGGYLRGTEPVPVGGSFGDHGKR